MNIAYLVLAHGQPKQLFRLIERLNQPNVHFYVHVDKKSVEADNIREYLSKYNNVVVISIHKVYWMGYNMVRSTLDLMQLAKDSGNNFKYFVLLSGQDYPIKSNNYINQFFEEHNEDFIDYNKLKYLGDKFMNKVRYHYHMDVPYYNPRNPGKIPRMVYLYYGLHRQYRKIAPHRRFFNNFEPYFGSQWFALTNDTVTYILQFCKENKGFVKFMKYTEGPDELFFQTILLNSERKTNVCGYNEFLSWTGTRKDGEKFAAPFSSLRYMDWSEKPGKSKPAILDMSYYDILKQSKELFARKLDEYGSSELLDKIDKDILPTDK